MVVRFLPAWTRQHQETRTGGGGQLCGAVRDSQPHEPREFLKPLGLSFQSLCKTKVRQLGFLYGLKARMVPGHGVWWRPAVIIMGKAGQSTSLGVSVGESAHLG